MKVTYGEYYIKEYGSDLLLVALFKGTVEDMMAELDRDYEFWGDCQIAAHVTTEMSPIKYYVGTALRKINEFYMRYVLFTRPICKYKPVFRAFCLLTDTLSNIAARLHKPDSATQDKLSTQWYVE